MREALLRLVLPVLAVAPAHSVYGAGDPAGKFAEIQYDSNRPEEMAAVAAAGKITRIAESRH